MPREIAIEKVEGRYWIDAESMILSITRESKQKMQTNPELANKGLWVADWITKLIDHHERVSNE